MSEKSSAWSDYLAAAHRLDAVRRDAAEVMAGESAAVAAARDELPEVQARLAMQAGRLLETAARVGAPPPVVQPGPAERSAAAQAVAGSPTVALATIRQARSTIDVADASLAGIDGFGSQNSEQAQRNLLVYGPLGLAALAIQILFALLVDDRTRILYAAACGFTFSAAAFVVGWLLVGLIFPKRPKTALLGAVACFAPALLFTVAVAAL
jgi:hypothetical protein